MRTISISICAICCFFFGGCGNSQRLAPGGDLPVTANRLIGTRFTDIRDDVSWDFGKSSVVIENKGQPIPGDVVEAVLAREMQCNRIQANWRLDDAAGLLILSNIAADEEVIDGQAKLAVTPAGHIRVNLDQRQYNTYPGKGTQR